MKSFSNYLGQRERDNKKHLHILLKVLETAGFEVKNHLDDVKEPYIYVKKPVDAAPALERLSFGGIRLYTRGRNTVCYRVQNKENTEPFGDAYELDIEGMFRDLVTEGKKERVALQIIFYIVKEIKEFFVNSLEAENDEDGIEQMGIVVGSNGTDYANQVTNIKGL